jgi:hypothetical protein
VKDYTFLNISVMVLEEPEYVEFISLNQREKGLLVGDNMWSIELIFDGDDYNLDSYPITIYAVDKAKNTALVDFVYDRTEDGIQNSEDGTQNAESGSSATSDMTWEEMEAGADLEDTVMSEAISSTEEDINEDVINYEEDNSEILGATNNEDSNNQTPGASYLIDSVSASNDMETIVFWTKIVILSICGFFFLAFLMQGYVIHHRGIHDKKYHPIFHATGLLCIMLVIIIM